MAKYTSRFSELGFYHGGELRKFSAGQYWTEDSAEIAVLDALADADRVEDEIKPEGAAPKTRKAASAK